MNSFGLGIVLDFTDNASNGMSAAAKSFAQLSGAVNSASGALNNMGFMQAAQNLNMLGSTASLLGEKILTAFETADQAVINAGASMFSYRNQFYQLYGSMEAGEAMIQQIKTYAEQSVFEVEDLMSNVAMMKVVGIDAMESVASTSGETVEKLIDYAADLAAMVPNIRNTYGTGISGAMGAIKEYVTEGNALTMKRSAGIDITGLLGEAKGETAEDRARQVADVIEQLGIAGYVESLNGTPQMMMSNMEDILFNTLTAISDAGVYEKYTDMISTVFNMISGVRENEERWNHLIQVSADLLNRLMTPLQTVIDTVADNAEGIMDWVDAHAELVSNVLAGVAAFGAFLFIGGKVLQSVSSILLALLALRQLGGIAGIVRSLTSAMLGLSTVALPAGIALAWVMWRYDIDNVHDAVVRLGEVLRVLWDALDGHVSMENWDLAEQLGLVNAITYIQMFRERLVSLFEGFGTGFMNALERLVPILARIGEFFGNIFATLSSSNMGAWNGFGEVLGNIAGTLLVAIPLFLTLRGLVSPILGLFGRLGGLLNRGSSNAGGSALSSPLQALKTLASLTILVGGTMALIAAIGLLTSNPDVQKVLGQGFDTVNMLFQNLIPVISTLGAFGIAAAVLGALHINPAPVAKAMLAIIVIIGIMTALVAAFGALALIPGIDSFMSEGGDLLVQVVEIIGRVAGALVGGFVGQFADSSLTLIGEGVTNFINAIAPGIEKASTLETGHLSELGWDLAGFVTAMTVSGLETILSLGAGFLGLDVIATQLSSFIDIMAPVFDSAADLNETGMEKTQKAIESITGVGNYAFRLAGLAQVGTGHVGIEGIAEQLRKAAPNMKEWFDAAAQMNDAGIDKSPDIFSSITSVGNYAFRLAGLAQLGEGHVGFEGIAQQLANAAPNMKSWFDAAAEMNPEGMSISPQVFEAISSVGNYEFRNFGLAQFIEGFNNIAGIAKQLSDAAPNLDTFFSAAADYDEGGMQKAPQVFEALAGMDNAAFRGGGLKSIIDGGIQMDKVGEQLSAFAENAGGFFTAIDSYSDSSIKNATGVIEAIGGLDSLNSGGLQALWNGGLHLDTIGTQLSSFGTNAKSFFETAGQLSSTSISNASSIFDALEKIDGSWSNMGGIKSWVEGDTALDTIGTQLKTFAEGIKPFFEEAGKIQPYQMTRATSIFESLENISGLSEIMNSYTVGNIASFGDELAQFGPNLVSFLTSIEDVGDLSSTVEMFNQLQEMLSSISETSTTSFSAISDGAGTAQTAVTELTTTVETMATEFTTAGTTATTALGTIPPAAQAAATAVTSIGTAAGRMASAVASACGSANGSLNSVASTASRVASQVSSALSSITTAAQNAQNSLNGVNVPQAATGVRDFIGGLIQVNEEGGELIDLPSGSTVIPHDKSVREALSRGIAQGAKEAMQAATAIATPTQYGATAEQAIDSSDNSVTFAKGAIVLQVNSTSDAELNKLARKIEKISTRQAEINRATRRNAGTRV